MRRPFKDLGEVDKNLVKKEEKSTYIPASYKMPESNRSCSSYAGHTPIIGPRPAPTTHLLPAKTTAVNVFPPPSVMPPPPPPSRMFVRGSTIHEEETALPVKYDYTIIRGRLMAEIYKALRNETKFPNSITINGTEIDLTIAIRDSSNGFIAFGAWVNGNKVVSLQLRPGRFVLPECKTHVQMGIMRILHGCLLSSMVVPSVASIIKEEYNIGVSFTPSSDAPPREGWLHITAMRGYVQVASLVLENAESS